MQSQCLNREENVELLIDRVSSIYLKGTGASESGTTIRLGESLDKFVSLVECSMLHFHFHFRFVVICHGTCNHFHFQTPRSKPCSSFQTLNNQPGHKVGIGQRKSRLIFLRLANGFSKACSGPCSGGTGRCHGRCAACTARRGSARGRDRSRRGERSRTWERKIS